MIRDVLLGLFGLVWAVVVVTTQIRTGEVPPELWAVLGIGVGGLLAAFRTDDRIGSRYRRRRPADGDDVEDTDV